MALILFIFTILLILLFEKKTKKIIPPTLVIVSIIFFIFYSSNIHVKNNFNHLSTSITKLGKIIIADNFSKEKKVTWNDVPTYYHEFRNFYGTWLMNKYIGGGIRSYRHNCPDRKYIKYYERTTCNTHPHNYYLEILTDLGVIGFILVSLIFLNVIYNSLIRRYFLKSELNINNLIFPIIFIFIAEIFPIRVSGSFFTTATSTYIFLLLSFLVALTNDKYQN